MIEHCLSTAGLVAREFAREPFEEDGQHMYRGYGMHVTHYTFFSHLVLSEGSPYDQSNVLKMLIRTQLFQNNAANFPPCPFPALYTGSARNSPGTKQTTLH